MTSPGTDLGRGRGAGAAPARAAAQARPRSWAAVDRVVVATRRYGGGAVAVDGLADPDPPRRDHPATAETAEVGDQTVLLRSTQRVLAIGLDPMELADGTAVAIAGTLDDHSRYLAGLQAGPGAGTAELVWAVMLAGIAECGIPSMSLTDNGIVYTGRLRGYESAFETNLRALGVRTINSAPYHPQTCGKIERFWQTLKKWLRARPPRPPLAELNALLERVPRFLQPPPTAIGPFAAPPRPRRSPPPPRPDPPTVRCRHRCSSPATPSSEESGNLFVPPYWSTSACAGPATTATASATATTSPSSAAPP